MQYVSANKGITGTKSEMLELRPGCFLFHYTLELPGTYNGIIPTVMAKSIQMMENTHT